MLSENQIKRLKEQCTKVDISYNKVNDFKDNDYYINIGWLQALNLVLEKDTYHISTKSLKSYEKGYDILMQFWDHIPDGVKEDVHKELKELGL